MSKKWSKGTGGPAGAQNSEHQGDSVGNVSPSLDKSKVPGVCYDVGNDRVSDTLTKNKSMTTSTFGDIALHNKVLVRRLTLKECGRLQGFPDGYLEGVPGYSDSKAYAAFGNSMTVQVMAWLGGRIDKVDKLMKEIELVVSNGASPLPPNR